MGETASIYPPNMHPQAYITTIAQKYGLKGIFYLDLWPVAESQVVVTDVELMDQVHVKRAFPQHKISDDYMAPIIGRNNIATANGRVWKFLHNAIAPALAPSHVKNLLSVMTEEIMTFRETLDRLADTGEVFSMEDISGKLIFDIIARVIFHFPLHAQTQGSPYLTDLREMVRLTEAQFSFNPLAKIKTLFQKRSILKRLHSSISSQIMARYRLLKEDKIVPSKKDPYSVLDLMLREHVQQGGPELKEEKFENLTSDYIELLITKFVFPRSIELTADITQH